MCKGREELEKREGSGGGRSQRWNKGVEVVWEWRLMIGGGRGWPRVRSGGGRSEAGEDSGGREWRWTIGNERG